MNCACDGLLSQQLLPMMRDVSGEFFIFQQHSAPAHLRLPDRNPVDYKIWSVVQQRVCQSWLHNVDELKQRLVHVWHGIEQTITDNAIDELALKRCGFEMKQHVGDM